MTWYLRPLDDHDAHLDTMCGGVVTAQCGVRFAPRRFACDCGAHSVPPPDADQVCVVCTPPPAVP